MFRNYLITAFRSFRNNRFYVLVNIFGLAIGVTCCLVVYTIMKHELTFDTWHKESDRIYRIVEHYSGEYGMEYQPKLPNAMPEAIQSGKSLISDVITMHGSEDGLIDFYIDDQYKSFQEEEILFANDAFLKYLDFPILQGRGIEALNEPFKVFLTKGIAEKYFGSENPVGKFITYNEFHELEVVGILADTPTNTNNPFKILVSYPTALEINNDYMKSWTAYWASTAYVVVNVQDDIGQLEGEINRVAELHRDAEVMERTTYHIQPIKEAHTDTKYDDGVNYVAPQEILIGFVLLASITLLASILNFINLATAQAVKRSREIGIRKTLGSSRSNLIVQFLSETLLLVVIATLFGFTLGQVFIDQMNNFLSIVSFNISYDITTVLFAIVLVVVVTVLAGFYPSLIISGYSPIQSIRNQVNLSKGSGRLSLRKTLVIAQFVIANLLIVCTIIVSHQMSYIQNKDLGFERENVLVLEFPRKSNEDLPVIKQRLSSLNFVENSTMCFFPPQFDTNWNTGYDITGSEANDRMAVNVKFVDQDYVDFYGLELLEGRNIENEYYTDTTMQVLVTPELLNRAGIPLEDAIGKTINFMGSWEGKIAGVVNDFHVWALQGEMFPVMLMFKPTYLQQINIKLTSNNLALYLPQIREIWDEFVDRGHFEPYFLNDNITQQYVEENLVYGVFQVFAVMAILIGIFGLYGLVSFMLEKNSKAISIRKVFGAGIGDILRNIGKEYLVLVVIACFIATPLSYFLSSEWLNEFAYRIDILPIHFISGLGLTILIMVATVAYKSYKAATANPVDSLRNE